MILVMQHLHLTLSLILELRWCPFLNKMSRTFVGSNGPLEPALNFRHCGYITAISYSVSTTGRQDCPNESAAHWTMDGGRSVFGLDSVPCMIKTGHEHRR